MKIKKEQVIRIMQYLIENPNFNFPFKVICEDFDKNSENYQVNCLDEFDTKFIEDNNLINFYLEENLQNLSKETLELMAKGFLEKIEKKGIIFGISNLAKEYRSSWKENLCESVDIEEYGLNEFLGGKAEAYEDCLDIIKKY